MAKKIKDQVTITLTDQQLNLISVALSAYARARAGQYEAWVSDTFPEEIISYADRKEIERILDKAITPTDPRDLNKNLAFEMHRAFRQYFSVKNNKGIWEHSISFHDPLPVGDIDPPRIHGFKKYIDVPVPKKHLSAILGLQEKGKYGKMWEYIKKHIQPTYHNADKTELVTSAEHGLVLRMHKPTYKNDRTQ